MKTVFFWLAWGIISVLVLRNFYFRYSKEKLEGLRRFSISLEILAIALFYFSWLPDGTTGLALLSRGHWGAWLALVMLIAVLAAFFTKRSALIKTGSLIHCLAIVFFFGLMIKLIPGTVELSSNIIAPIIASLLLLINFVVVLLLWQQLQLKERKL